MLRKTLKPAAPPRRRFRRSRLAQLLLLLALAGYLLFRLEQHIRPVLLSVVEYESRRYARTAFNEAVARSISQDPDAYNDLYAVSYGSDGSVGSVQANTYRVNQLAAALARQVETEMNAREDSVLSIPIGTLLGFQALAGRGPRLEMRVLPESYVSAQVYDTLESAGINQTKLCVYVHFTMDMSVILSGYTASVTAENDVLLSQILLVGRVPESYWGAAGRSAAAPAGKDSAAAAFLFAGGRV